MEININGLMDAQDKADREHLATCRLPAFMCKECTRIFTELGVRVE